MSPKLSKLQNFKKNFKDALLKYKVVKFHNFTWSINHTVSNWKWGRWKLGWVYVRLSRFRVHSISFEPLGDVQILLDKCQVVCFEVMGYGVFHLVETVHSEFMKYTLSVKKTTPMLCCMAILIAFLKVFVSRKEL